MSEHIVGGVSAGGWLFKGVLSPLCAGHREQHFCLGVTGLTGIKGVTCVTGVAGIKEFTGVINVTGNTVLVLQV